MQEKSEYRLALGRFATGITVVTVDRESGERPGVRPAAALSAVHGMTANSFTSVSLDPPQILVCVARHAVMLPLMTAAARFGVTVLRADQQAHSEYFARAEQDAEEAERLAVRFVRSAKGTPLLAGGLATLDCRKVAACPSGDHTIFVGEVEGLEWIEGDPLIYFAGQYRALS